MARYYVNRQPQPGGQHEVHRQGCSYMPSEANRRYLGDFVSCHGAVRAAKAIYPNSDGCYYCSRECHTG